ncbi:hypothetical protein P3T23_000363 [Paraburkholderia sp. GAS448]|jgi:hypothetical protein|uniref:hypothetical protein n=1 Tax=Paraburkholderia sp. GAS448 TaxID=3035136 RepID=UPI003D1F8032
MTNSKDLRFKADAMSLSGVSRSAAHALCIGIATTREPVGISAQAISSANDDRLRLHGASSIGERARVVVRPLAPVSVAGIQS